MGPSDASAVCSSRNCHSIAADPCDLLPADKPNDTCKCAPGVPFFVGVLRWTPRKAVAVVVVVGHLLLTEAADLAPVVVLAWICNICQ